MTRQRHGDDDDRNVRYHGDGHGPLRDGERLRTPLHMMDAMQRDVARHAARITDAMGESGPALRRPGYRVSDAFPRDWSVYGAYDEAVSRMWKNNAPTGAGPSGLRGERESDSVCEPDRSHQDAMTMDEVYRAYDLEISQRWRTP
jgi:hypothetical protein